jgi:hypothetical protein
MPKHPVAIYYDSNGVRSQLLPYELHDVGKRAFARATELWDEDEEYRLYPRYRADSPHFYSLSNKLRRLHVSAETDPAHNRRVDELFEILDSGANYKIGFNTWDSDGEKKEEQFVVFTETRGYTWGKEVTRALSEDTSCRHDLFGAPKALQLTSRCPWVAIEVVKHHYPDDSTFEAFLSLSKSLPLVVLFDFVDVKNYFFYVKNDERAIRVVYYIYDGSVWKGERRWENCSPAFFREKVSKNIQDVIAKRKSA